jgi:hypothetical protein
MMDISAMEVEQGTVNCKNVYSILIFKIHNENEIQQNVLEKSVSCWKDDRGRRSDWKYISWISQTVLRIVTDSFTVVTMGSIDLRNFIPDAEARTVHFLKSLKKELEYKRFKAMNKVVSWAFHLCKRIGGK